MKDAAVSENIEQGSFKFDPSQLERMEPSDPYSNTRSVTKLCRLPAGIYVIIPTTFECGQSCTFFLRIFTKKGSDQTTKR